MNIKFLSLLTFCFFSLTVLAQRTANKETEKLDYLLYYLNNNYVDTVSSHKIVEEGIRAMLKELDPHSVYISKE